MLEDACSFLHESWQQAHNVKSEETPECRTFREHYSSLYHAIQDPLSLAAQLYSQGIIAPAVKEQMSVVGLSRLEKNNVLLSAVEMKIQTDASVLHVFLATLNEDSSMQSLVKTMQGMISHKFYSTVIASFSGTEEGEKERLVHTVCACA